MRNCWLVSASILCGAICAAAPYAGFYTGTIIPTPQHVTMAPQAWEVGTGKSPQLSLLLPREAGEAERLAAEDIAARVRFLCGAEPQVRCVSSLPTGGEGTFIALGLPGSATPPERPEGYVIRPREQGAARGRDILDRPTRRLCPVPALTCPSLLVYLIHRRHAHPR